ncbi:MAG: putative glutathione S-transferase [Cellvibrionaceae bacterium]|jgi:putative glutathione S-transferase
MGVMIDGVYRLDDELTTTDASGNWQRAKMVLRHWVTADGSAGPTGHAGFKAESGRYHLYVAWNCPWAHRTLLARLFKGLNAHISISVALPRRTDQGWVFDAAGEFSDPLLSVRSLHEVYGMEPEPYTGRITVPVLWDKVKKQIVSTESADIVRMLNTAFAAVVDNDLDLYPEGLAADIDRWNDLIYATVNNGVYRAGFASSQEAYASAAHGVFETLDLIDEQLSKTRYLTGDRLTEADLRLFPTLARFDVAYYSAFKCNLRRLADYRSLWPYAREIYQIKGVAETVRFDVYKRGYFSPSKQRNPLGIVPIGPIEPELEWGKMHGRKLLEI